MASSNHKSTKEVLRMRKNFSPLHVLFPLKTRLANSADRRPLRDGARNAQVRTDGANRSPLPFFSYGAKVKLIDKIKLEINPDQSDQRVEPKTLSPAELHRLYAGTLVPQHRYLSTALTEAVNSPDIAPHPSKWLASVPGIDLPKLTGTWLSTNRNAEYEQLYCIGLASDTGQLTGVLTVKRGSGYSGGPHTAGSREYVAFWVDWGSGFKYEGTASVRVHDFGWLPSAGLEYNVSLPIDLLSRARLKSEVGKIVKVRAVLSWNTPPSTTDPNAPVVWGNVMECRILIPPSDKARVGSQLRSLGTAGTEESDETNVDGQIVDAAIKALKGMAFGLNAGLTVAPDGVTTNSGVTDQSFTINAQEIQDGTTCALRIWKRSSANGDAMSNLEHSSAGFCPQEKN
jgi:hypothetical protein